LLKKDINKERKRERNSLTPAVYGQKGKHTHYVITGEQGGVAMDGSIIIAILCIVMLMYFVYLTIAD